jgi:AcrR family transcriptional regulator
MTATRTITGRRQSRRTQQQRKADTRSRLLEAAAGLLAELGVEGLSVDAVAAAAGRTSGAVYAHFGSKQGLLLALLDQWRHALLGAVTREFERSEDLAGRLRSVAANVVVDPSEGTRRLLALERELWRLAPGEPAVAEALTARAAEAQAAMTRGFAAWVDEGRIAADHDPATLATTFRALVDGLVTRQRHEGDLDVAEAAAALAVVVRPPDRPPT